MTAEVLTAEAILARARHDGVRRAAMALRKPPIPSRLLQELADLAADTLGQQFVAAYPLSPSHLLEQLARAAQDPEVFPLLATNPRTPPHLLTEFAAHENPEVRAHVATHPQLASRELLNLAGDSDFAVRRAVATNPSLRLPHHAALVADANAGVRLRLAALPALPAQVAHALAADASPVVRAHTVATATADDELLLGWATGAEEEIQLALAARKELPAAARRWLLLSSFPSVRRAVRETGPLDEIALLHFVTQGEAEERAWIAARGKLPSALQRLLAQDADLAVRVALAANPALTTDIARYFVALAEESVCAALATNPALSADLVEALAATRSPAVLTAFAYRPDLPEELALILLEHSPDFLRHWAIQRRPVVIDDSALARTLATHALPSVRALGVSGHAWRRADLYEFARDPALAVRLAVLRHANAPGDLLAAALVDSNPEVAAAAKDVQSACAAREAAARAVLPAPVVVVRKASTLPQVAPEPTEASTFVRRVVPVSRADKAPTLAEPAPKLFNQLKRLFWQ